MHYKIISHNVFNISQENPYSPRSRKPVHSNEMDTSGVSRSSSPQSHQNLKYGEQHDVMLDELPDFRNSGDNVDSQKDEIMDDSDTESLTNSSTSDGRQEGCHISLEPAQSSSKGALRKEEPQKAGIDPSKMKTILSCIVVMMGICVYYLCVHYFYRAQEYAEKVQPPSSVTVQKAEREKYLRMDIQRIRDEFPSQLNTTWQAFSAGIKDVQETPTKPSVFLLLHETEGGTPACLAWKIGNISAHFLSAKNTDPVVLDGANIEKNQTLAEDYGILLDEYGPTVEERRTMIVKDLHKIPGIVAQSFHWFCDTVRPLVDKAIYLFTMKASGVSHAQHNPSRVAEKELRKLWNGQLHEDKLIPLIVRITDSVMVIMPEKHHMSCP
jgi:hypothetical protein